MKTYVSLKNEHKRELPQEFRADDDAEGFVQYILNRFTKPGDVVFDPFMGFGTTLVVAEELDRVGYGIEFDEKRWRYVQSLLKHPERALHGDSTKLDSLPLPDFDFSMTSPPYMGAHHKENPFTAYTTEIDGYEQYLATIKGIYRLIAAKLKPGSHAVIEVSNLKHDDAPITTLAWDIAREIADVLRFTGEIVVAWEDSCNFGYDHSYCLVYQK